MPLDQEPEIPFYEIHEVVVPHLGHVPVAKGDFSLLPKSVQSYIAYYVDYLRPRGIYLCDGSEEEANEVIHKLLERGTLETLPKYENCYICRTDPADVARVEGKTYICTKDKYETVPHSKPGAKGGMGQWISPEDLESQLNERFPGCMAGRMMYVIPFSMGPIGSPLSKIGIQITDSNYVLLCMRIMTRVHHRIWDLLKDGREFVKCIHSMGCPRPWSKKVINHWPCNPEKILISHFPAERKVKSFGSGYGGNSLLGKKCFALRIASVQARDEGWMAEHMLITGITTPEGKEYFVAAAFPSACGKTNLAMIQPTLPGYKVRVVGDDIAWMRFDDKGQLRGINPEYGFFGVAPGTNWKTNPNAMATFQKNSIFTNVAKTADGGFFWEGMEDEVDKDMPMTTWLGKPWKIGEPGLSSHPNARFTAPAGQCPIIHPQWEDPEGVPIHAIIFGGRRPTGVPVVYETFDWPHGVAVGASVKSETTAAAEFKGKSIMHDPMAMRPFMGYNFGHYLQHWLDMEKPGRTMPKIFHVNWFRVDEQGKFVWPGFGDNIRVFDWMIKRLEGQDVADETAIGFVPKPGSLNCDGLNVDWNKMFDLPKDYWKDDIKETKNFLETEVGDDLPQGLKDQLDIMEKRISGM